MGGQGGEHRFRLIRGTNCAPQLRLAPQTLGCFLRPCHVLSNVCIFKICMYALFSALHRAVRVRSPEFVELLLEKKAKINAVNRKGDTALHLAMRARSKKVVEVLLRLPKNNRLLYKPNDQVSLTY